ncbi:hypothetical protein F2Q69_00017814 [Brassica cretica]|uniref:EF-hand domain-containing protein n=1 Tax=Brassica cretica TaxID=69181 RepID=A0A8S9R7U5_BRACR|nr:hypothetical protein F2Q69_00017814 [Brassica cretica]
MKLATSLNSKFLRLSPKRIFRSKSKSSSVSRSEPSSFSSGASSDGSYSDLKPGPAATPISVLPGDHDGFYSELIQAFKLIDRDDDGVVSRRDLDQHQKLKPPPPAKPSPKGLKPQPPYAASLEATEGRANQTNNRNKLIKRSRERLLQD